MRDRILPSGAKGWLLAFALALPLVAQAGTAPIATIPKTTKVRVDAREPATASVDLSPIYRIHTADVEGWMIGSALVPRDSTAPRVWEVSDGTGAFSPNGDGQNDVFSFVDFRGFKSFSFKVFNRWGMLIYEGKSLKDTTYGVWKPTADTPDGTYFYVFNGTGANDAQVERSGHITLVR